MSHSIIAIVDNLDCLAVSHERFYASFPWPDHIQGLVLTGNTDLSDPRLPSCYCAPLTPDSQPLQLTNRQGDSLVLAWATAPEIAGIAPPVALLTFTDWLSGTTTDRWWLMPWPLVAVSRALFNIHRLDPYLGAHYARQLSHILSVIPTAEWLSALSKHSDSAATGTQFHHFANQFRQFEKKIVRQYATHP